MSAAEVYAQCSTARRAQVGCILVKDDRIISIGYNGMPSGDTNVCEDIVYAPPQITECNSEWPLMDTSGKPFQLVTKQEVLHAESNAVAKLAKSHESGNGAVAFVTLSPCIDCAKLLYQAGIVAVFYKNRYKTNHGIELLQKYGINVYQIDEYLLTNDRFYV
jgi:Deoxycytidylate deaminase